MDATAIGRTSLSERTILAGREVFLGRRRGPLSMLPFAGPAVIASIAYMDPGIFATNIQPAGIWLRTPLGGTFRQSRRDAVSGALRQDRDRHWAEPRRAVSRTFRAARRVHPVAGERNRGDGDRAGGAPRRQRRARIVERHTPAGQHAPRRDLHLRGTALTAF